MTSTQDEEPDAVARIGRASEGTEGRARTTRPDTVFGRLVEWLTVYGERAGDVLVYSSAYISIIAMAEVAIAMVLLSLPPNLSPVVVGLVTFAVYTNDRIADAATDMVSNPRQATFVVEYRNELYVLAALAYALAVTLSVLHGPLALAITLVPGAFWVLYASDWVPDVVVHFRRLKELLVINSAIVALAWAVTLTLLPVAFAGAPLTPAAGVVLAYFFLRSFVDTEIPNVRDVEGDRVIGVSTLPVVFGVARTRQMLYGIDLLTLGLVLVAARAGLVATWSSLALGVGLLVSLGVISLIGRVDDIDTLSLASQFEYLVVFALLVAVAYGP